MAKSNYTGQFELSHLVHRKQRREKIATFVVYLKYESVLLKEVREDLKVDLFYVTKKIRASYSVLKKQMYSFGVANIASKKIKR